LAAAKLDESAERPSAASTLHRLLAEYNALAETAKAAHDAAAYKAWSAAAERIATSLLQFEVPKLAAVMTPPRPEPDKVTEFVLRIFERPRVPLKQIEATAIADNAAAPAAEAKVVDADAAAAEPIKQPDKPDKETATAPQAAASSPPSDINAYPIGSGRPLGQHPLFNPHWGAPFGSRHRH
jgi:hypothetical protein